MIEVFLMLIGMLVICYSFYSYSRTMSAIRKARLPHAWRISMRSISVLLALVLFIFGFVLFGFISVLPTGEDYGIMIMGFAFLAFSFLTHLIVRASSSGAIEIAHNSQSLKVMYQAALDARSKLEERMRVMEKELETARSKESRDFEKMIGLVSLEEKYRTIQAAKDTTEKKYYKRQIDDSTFRKMMQDYEEKLIVLEEAIKQRASRSRKHPRPARRRI